MLPHRYLSILVAVGAATWVTLLAVYGVHVPLGVFFKPFSVVEGALLVLMTLFDSWAWRWRALRPWLVSTPDLNGTWKGEIVSTWVPAAEPHGTPIQAYLAIHQTFSFIRIRLMTRESNSNLLTGSVARDPSGLYVVTGIYRNVPDLLRRSTSPIHHGAMLLEVRENPPRVLQGEYWTDRDTKGELRFTARNGRVLDSFDAAAAARYG